MEVSVSVEEQTTNTLRSAAYFYVRGWATPPVLAAIIKKADCSPSQTRNATKTEQQVARQGSYQREITDLRRTGSSAGPWKAPPALSINTRHDYRSKHWGSRNGDRGSLSAGEADIAERLFIRANEGGGVKLSATNAQKGKAKQLSAMHGVTSRPLWKCGVRGTMPFSWRVGRTKQLR